MKYFDKQLFLGLFFAFILATIAGTLSHEFGHYLVAKYLGYNATINYASTQWRHININEQIPSVHYLLILIGGPIQTMLTGTIGLILLWIFRKSFYNTERLSIVQWCFIIISLFWLRQTANLVTWIGGYFYTGHFSTRGDEIRIALYLGLPFWSLSVLTAIIGAFILALIIFKIIPGKQRLTFVISGFTGGITGYILWLVLLGKYIMP
ncbi:MAG: hypothetical protein WCT77_08900 [Bacteroidota bacterium]